MHFSTINHYHLIQCFCFKSSRKSQIDPLRNYICLYYHYPAGTFLSNLSCHINFTSSSDYLGLTMLSTTPSPRVPGAPSLFGKFVRKGHLSPYINADYFMVSVPPIYKNRTIDSRQ